MLRFVSNGRIAPGPPCVSQVGGCTVFWMRSMSDWKSACAPPADGGPKGIDGVEPVPGGPDLPPGIWANALVARSPAAARPPPIPAGGGPTSTGLKQLFQIQPEVPFVDPSKMVIYVQGPK